MKTILYTQNESATTKNTLVVDGERFDGINASIASEAFRFINAKSGETGNYVWLLEQLKKYGKIISQNFQFRKDDAGIFIKACFQEKDELGRNMPFLFYMKSGNIHEACSTLKACAGSIGRSCFDAELNILENLGKYIKICVGISLILLIIIILWRL